MPYLARIARASAVVVGSATVGPEAMTAGSSPGTSEIRRATTRAGCAATARRPPLMALRCLRTQLISSIEAPDASIARLTACLSAVPLGRRAQQSRPAAGNERDDKVLLGKALDEFEDPASGLFASRVRHRVRGFNDLDALAGRAMAVTGDDEARKLAGPMLVESARHRCRRFAGPHNDRPPPGLAGRRREIIFAGSAAAIAASNRRLRNARADRSSIASSLASGLALPVRSSASERFRDWP